MYKNTFTGIEVKTFYGYLKPVLGFDFTCGDNGSQSCRRKVLSNPDKYPDAFQYGTPYKSVVDQKTKDFVKTLISKFNQ